MGPLLLQEIHFPELPLVVLLVELRLFLACCLEDVALPGGVISILPTKIAIQLGVLLLEFITMLIFGLEALFLPCITVLV